MKSSLLSGQDRSVRRSPDALVEAATTSGDVTGVIHAAGVSPSQAAPATILAIDLYGTALVLEEFGNVIAHGGAGVVIASQSGHRLGALSPDQNAALATTPADELLKLPMLQLDQVTDALLMGRDGAFITGSDFLMDGGVTASYFYGELAPSEPALSIDS